MLIELKEFILLAFRNTCEEIRAINAKSVTQPDRIIARTNIPQKPKYGAFETVFPFES